MLFKQSNCKFSVYSFKIAKIIATRHPEAPYRGKPCPQQAFRRSYRAHIGLQQPTIRLTALQLHPCKTSSPLQPYKPESPHLQSGFTGLQFSPSPSAKQNRSRFWTPSSRLQFGRQLNRYLPMVKPLSRCALQFLNPRHFSQTRLTNA